MQQVADPLWPVALLCGLVIAATTTLEVLARAERVEWRTVNVVDTRVTVSSADGEDEGDALAVTSAKIVNEEHRRARALARRGELEPALALFEKLLESHPRSGFLRADYGYWLIKAKRYEQASEALKQAQDLQEDTTSVALNLGAALRRMGDAQAAEAAFRHALQLNPGHLDARLALAQLFRRQGKMKEALTLLKQAASAGSNEGRARALFELGRTQLADRRASVAAKTFEEAVNRAPASPDLRWRIARAWLHDGHRSSRELALKAADHAALLAPDDVGILITLGQAREAHGDRAAAKSAYERALQQDPEQAYPRRRLLRIALSQGDYQLARHHANALIRFQPDEPEHHFLRGLVAARDEQTQDARKHYNEAIKTAQGDYPEAWFNLGLLERHAGNLEAAIAAYQKAIGARPKYLAAMNNLGLALAAAGQSLQAEATYQQAVAIDAKYAPAWKNLARLYSHKSRYPEAINALQRAVDARPGDLGAARRLAAAKLSAGDVPAALRQFRNVLDRAPQDSRAWVGLSQAQAKSGQREAAQQSVERALQIDPDSVSALRQRAALLLAGGALARAREAYRDVIDREPGDVAARIAYAEVLQRAGEYRGCSEEASRALRVDQDSLRARELQEICAKSGN
jgi:tetratricopeptide (TPR) repeat protein